MAAFMAAIHFPETVQERNGFWKMDGRDKPGHDGIVSDKTLRLCVSA